MNQREKARIVYSTAPGGACPKCGWPLDNCRCSTRTVEERPSSRAGKMVAKLRLEKKGRAGKSVTVVAGLPLNASLLKELCQDLKRACGTGGAVSEDTIELQGDLRDRVREYLLKKDFVVKV